MENLGQNGFGMFVEVCEDTNLGRRSLWDINWLTRKYWGVFQKSVILVHERTVKNLHPD